jgi:hypothetical protein
MVEASARTARRTHRSFVPRRPGANDPAHDLSSVGRAAEMLNLLKGKLEP